MNSHVDLQKVLRDPYYGPLYKKRGLQFCLDAGYFEDSLSDEEYHAPLQLSPLILANASGTLLLATGAMCPIHQGHMRMLEIATDALIKKGHKIAGALLSPAHDEYIMTKTGQHYSLGYRIPPHISKEISNHPYLGISYVEMSMAGAVNFTEVYRQHILIHGEDVWFVCGSDNARFCLAFIDAGKCIIVLRPGSEDEFEKFKSYDDNKRILFVKGDSIKMSSRDIRHGKR